MLIFGWGGGNFDEMSSLTGFLILYKENLIVKL